MRFGLIGSNFIVDSFVEAARECPGVFLQATYSRTKEQAGRNAEKWGIPTIHTDLDRLAGDPEVDAVYIASPNICHCEQTEMMLRAGKHVLCEKPIVPSEAELKPLLELAQQQGVLLLEAIRPAFLPGLGIIREQLSRLGTLRYAEFAYAQYSSRYERFLRGIVENAFNPALCNGTLLDLGVYCVHWMLALLGEPKSICAQASFLEGSIDCCGAALCEFSGMQAAIRYSKVHGSAQPAVIEGENGTLLLRPFPIPAEAELCLRGKEPEIIALDTDKNDMKYEIQRFVELAAHPLEARGYHRKSAAALRVMDEIRRQCGIDFRR